MDSRLCALMASGAGLCTWREMVRAAPEWTVQAACRAGRLVRVLPGVYVDAALILRAGADVPLLARVEPELARRAALAYADGRGALSRLTALDVWGLRRQPPGEPVYADVPTGSGLRDRPPLVLRHRTGFAVEPPQVVVRGGLPVTRLDRTLMDCWPLLPLVDRAGPVIRAVNDRLTTPQRLVAALAEVPRMPDRAALRALVDRLTAGCRSPLEIWGHDHVFKGAGMPALVRQAPIRVGGRTIYLDVFAEAERVNVELDGATTHGDPAEREIDLRRDALLATIGILVVRFTHRRLMTNPADVSRQTLAILASRRSSS
jgi:very-short-patch-repair endonuclease